MQKLASVRIVAWEGASLWVVDAAAPTPGEPRRTGFHAHHAIQVTLSLGGWFHLESADARATGDIAAVASDTSHRFDAAGLGAHLFIDPESRAGRAVSARFFADDKLVMLPVQIAADFSDKIAAACRAPRRDDHRLIHAGRALVAALAAESPCDEPDARIQKAIALAAERITGAFSLSDAVAVTGLSASRLRHLFVEQTGLPFKTYLLWLRLTRAIDAYATGASLTDVAHGAGFADSAHFTRTFRRMFGVAPGALRTV